MRKVESFIEDISQARHFKATMRGASAPRRIQLILSDSAAVSLRPSDVDGYLMRAASLVRRFGEIFPDSREVFLLRAPGRVNLIGEHTDYNGLPVLPIAINRDIMLAVAPRADTTVEIHNVDDRFTCRSFEVSEEIEPYSMGDWGNYAKAAVQSLQSFFSDSLCSDYLKGLNVVVDGNIPMASGLASSSALVVSLAMALLHAHGQDVTRLELAKLLAKGEHYVGTRGGGMDQTVCLLAEENHAMKIEFSPLRIEQVPVPAGFSFVVCHSSVAAPKASSARLAYNLRAAESRLAAALLNAALTKAYPARINHGNLPINRLGDLYRKELDLSESGIDALAETTFRKDAYSIDEIALLLGKNEANLRKSYLASFTDNEVSLIGKLKLLTRFRHVLSEGKRVRRAAEALRKGKMLEFGGLMYESHTSCAKDYEISTPDLDTLVHIASEAGALGSRLTGAGFGGCTISLVCDKDLGEFIKRIQEKYYGAYLSGKKHGPEQNPPSEYVFVCKAVGSADELFA
jgi:N-acetylgalactosamine kinase